MSTSTVDHAVSNKLTPSPERGFYGWKLIGVLWFIYFLNMGFPLYGGAVINTYMLKQIPMPRSIFGLGFTLLNLCIGVPSVLIAATILKWGIRRTFAIGSALIFLGSMWMAFVASQPWHYLVGFGVLIGSGIGFGTMMPISTVVTRWFKRYRGRAMAITLTASGFAGLAGAPLMNKVLAAAAGNWQLAWEVVACASVLAAVVAHFAVKERPEDLGQDVDGISSEAAAANPQTDRGLVTKDEWTPGEAYRSPAFWIIFLGAIACQFPFFFFTAHWILHLRGAGMSPANAALAMGLYTMGGICGRLLAGPLLDRFAPRYVFMLGLLLFIVGSVLAIQVTSSNLPVAFAAAILYGAGFGWSFVSENTILANFFGAKIFPKLNGTLLLLAALVCSPAGIIGGKLFDVYRSYKPAFELNEVLCVMGIVALAFARMPKRKIS